MQNVLIEFRIQRSNDSGLCTVVSRILCDRGCLIGFGPTVTFTNRADAEEFYGRLHG